jgi:hypothetical protein
MTAAALLSALLAADGDSAAAHSAPAQTVDMATLPTLTAQPAPCLSDKHLEEGRQ